MVISGRVEYMAMLAPVLALGGDVPLNGQVVIHAPPTFPSPDGFPAAAPAAVARAARSIMSAIFRAYKKIRRGGTALGLVICHKDKQNPCKMCWAACIAFAMPFYKGYSILAKNHRICNAKE